MRKLAIMKNVSFGCRDTNHAVLWFNVNTGESESLQFLSAKDAVAFIEKNSISDIKYLEGKPCWVGEADGMMRFIDLAKV